MGSDDFSETGLRASFKAAGLSPYMENAVVRWILTGARPGDFGRAMISNDLRETVFRADAGNLQTLLEWMRWWHNCTPSGCHGSAEAMESWSHQGGLNGKAKP